MRNNLFALSAVALTVLVSGQAFAGEGPDKFDTQNSVQSEATYGYQGKVSSHTAPGSFTIVRLNELNRSERASINAAASAEHVQAVQASIDAATSRELRAHGVQLNNVVASDTAFNGRTIYFVK